MSSNSTGNNRGTEQKIVRNARDFNIEVKNKDVFASILIELKKMNEQLAIITGEDLC